MNKFWKWKNQSIRYVHQPPPEDLYPTPLGTVILIHGFGGNCDHWRRNLLPLSSSGLSVYAIDLLGYGYSSKPNPKSLIAKNNASDPSSLNSETSIDFSSFPTKYNGSPTAVSSYDPRIGSTPFTDMEHPLGSAYNFYTWSEQVNDFINEIVPSSSVHLVCNSIGSCVGLQTSISHPSKISSCTILDPSLRLLNVKRQSPFVRPFVRGLQYLLRESDIGSAFFGNVATRKTVKNVLEQAYSDGKQVSEELVDCILDPGLERGAVDVFLDFISYSGGPLPEEQMRIIDVEELDIPVGIGWGKDDPWEPVEDGRAFKRFECVKRFEEFEGVGHCPMDENPGVVNDFIVGFIDGVINEG
ncbi:hypothetical protein TrVE_jg3485 [Triparma verrucosa]|uniref:AB hydrolase-1 domain-containing protein n=1 Tax=Triparma verrucosa TaxID=1606542 RepID=A0A9W7BHW1_9STRA|nr:hypothetical protein TrVE_jg3485 [Triparma verrucosa]